MPLWTYLEIGWQPASLIHWHCPWAVNLPCGCKLMPLLIHLTGLNKPLWSGKWPQHSECTKALAGESSVVHRQKAERWTGWTQLEMSFEAGLRMCSGGGWESPTSCCHCKSIFRLTPSSQVFSKPTRGLLQYVLLGEMANLYNFYPFHDWVVLFAACLMFEAVREFVVFKRAKVVGLSNQPHIDLNVPSLRHILFH